MTDTRALFPALCAHPAPGAGAAFAALARKLAFGLGDKTYPPETLQASVCRGLRVLLVRAVPTMARHRAWDDEEGAAEEDEAAAAAGGADDNDGGADAVEAALNKARARGGAAGGLALGDTRAMGQLEDAATLAAAMGPLGKNFVPLLFNLLDQAHGIWTSASEARAATASAEGGEAKPTSTGRGIGGSAEAMAHLAETIRCYAAVAEPKLLAKLCKQVASKLGKSVSDLGRSGGAAGGEYMAATRTIVVLLSISTSLIASGALPARAAWSFYQKFAPLLSDESAPIVQKRAYLALEELCRHHVARGTRSETLPVEAVAVLSASLTSSLVACSARSKMRRLHCLELLIASNQLVLTDLSGGGGSAAQVLAGLVGEVMLCTKESNNKTRAAAYSVIIALGKVRCYLAIATVCDWVKASIARACYPLFALTPATSPLPHVHAHTHTLPPRVVSPPTP